MSPCFSRRFGPADIWTEIAKACIQLVVVVGLGGIVGVMLRSVDERRDERRFDIFQELFDAVDAHSGRPSRSGAAGVGGSAGLTASGA